MKNGGQLPISSAIKYYLLLYIHFVYILLGQCGSAGTVFTVAIWRDPNLLNLIHSMSLNDTETYLSHFLTQCRPVRELVHEMKTTKPFILSMVG